MSKDKNKEKQAGNGPVKKLQSTNQNAYTIASRKIYRIGHIFIEDFRKKILLHSRISKTGQREVQTKTLRQEKLNSFYFIFSRRRLIRCKTAESSSKYFGGGSGCYFDGPQSFRYNGDLLYKQANWVTLTLLDYGWRLSSPNLEILVAFVGNTWTRCHTQISTQHFSRVMTLLKSFYTKLAPEMGEELNYFAKNRPTFLRHYKV